MPGRHSAPSSVPGAPALKWGAAAVAALVVVAGGIFAFNALGGPDCDDVTEYAVAADPSIAPVLQKVTDGTSEADLGCVRFAVSAADPSQTSANLAKGQDVPALWVPDSAMWLGKVSRSTGAAVDVAAQSIAATPAVLVGRAAEPMQFETWLATLERSGLRIGDPLIDSVAGAPILGAQAETEAGKVAPDAVAAALVPIAQAQARNTAETSADERLGEVAADGGVAVATEQQVVAYQAAHPEVALAAVVPSTGSVVLNFPVAVTEPAGATHDGARAAGVELAEAMASEAGRAALSEAGFRATDGAPLGGDRGVGAVVPLVPGDQAAVEATLRKYAVLALPSRALGVVDVSGSMSYSAGPQTRMALTTKAGETGVSLFPDNAQMGLWAFSIGLGGGGQDYRELVPIRGMAEQVDGVSQREKLNEGVRSLTTMVGGGTGLYDTTLAAFRKVKEDYDPSAINSVILLTDGANEDPGSISLDELLDTLRREQDPSRPVIIVTIGVTEDADAAVLQQISAATGGTSHIARNPAEIPNVFVDAMRSRAAG
ncbi:VWA domain-containing protein [Rhodococcus sp. NPDC058514]|uniref:VWA domain-containing protein n=1 Tax=unclassified Rhodococcus (in: high G+C Gram-positive bacteria) TaxID=192944 RepID=UPI003664E439